ncbi:MAG: ATP-binding protein [Mariprofundaceae bacterium]
MKNRIHIILVLLLISILTFYGYVRLNTAASESRAQLNQEVSLSIHAIALDIEVDLKHLVYSMLFIVDQVYGHDPFSNEESRDVLSEDFLSFLNTSAYFDQIRLLDPDGLEITRAEYGDGSPSLADPGGLQNKGSRYYFQEAMKLGKRQVYLSPLDLNVEHGEIDIPIKPTLRLAMPSFDTPERKSGVAVINALGQPILDHFSQRVSEVPVPRVYWLNENGYWLAGEEPEKLWGFMYPDRQDQTLAVRDPQAWKTIAAEKRGSVTGADGVYVFSTIIPQQAAAGVNTILSIEDTSQWKIVAFYTDDEFQTYFAEKHNNQITILVLLGISLLALFWIVIIYHNQRIMKQQYRQREVEMTREHERMKSTGIIAGGIAHEFNNILSGMTGNIFLLKRDLIQAGDNQYLSSMNHQIKRAAKLIRYLLTFSRQGFVRMKQLDISKLVRQQCEDFLAQLSNNIELTVDCESGVRIEADKEKINSIVWELLANSAEAMVDGVSSKIFVALKPADYEFSNESGEVCQGPFVCLSVSDSGCGIAADVLPYIYDPFYTNKPIGEGVGLGLSSVYGAVKIHHGDIKVTSKAGEGARFDIYLPITQPDKK